MYNTNIDLRNPLIVTPVGLILFNLDKNYCYTGFSITHKETIEQIWGVEISIGISLLEIIQIEDDKLKAKQNFDRALRGESFYIEEEYGSGKNRKWWENRYSPIFNEENNVIGLTIFVIDITERKKLENKLKESEERYKTFIAKSNEAFYRFELKEPIDIKLSIEKQIDKIFYESVLVEYNYAYEFLYKDTDLNPIKGRSISLLKGEENKSLEYKIIENFIKNGYESYRVLKKFKDFGRVQKVTLNNYVGIVENGKLIRIWGTISDITENFIKNEQYRSILETSIDGFWIVNKSGRINEINDSYCKLIGYSREELLLMNISDLEIEESDNETKQHIEDIEKNGSDRFETKHRKKNGEIIDVEISVQYITEIDLFVVFVRDISLRKESERILKESEAKFKDVFERAADAIFIADKLTGDIVDLNSKAEKILEKEKNEIIGLKQYEIYNPSGKNFLDDSFFENGYLVRTNGLNIPVEIMSSEINYNGRICSMGIFRDITKRLELENKIRRETYFKDALLKESSDGIVVMNEWGKVLEFNNAFQKMLGYTHEEMVKLSVWDWEFDDSIDEINKLLSSIDEAGAHFIRTHKRKDGTTYKAEISTNASTFDNLKLIFCIIRDISERENLITELLQKDNEVKKAHRIAKISNWSWDFDTKEVVWSDEFFEIVKYKKEAIPQTLKEAKFLFTKNSFELINKSIDEAVELGKIFEVELDLICSDSKVKTVNLKGEPKFDKKKVFTGFRGILQDITESKLQQVELIKAKEEAEKADRLKSEFLSQMSHEIRTPINAILSFIGLIREEVSDYMNEDILESFQIIDNASRRLIRTIDLILNMSSIQAGSYDYSPQNINIDKILFDLVVEFKPIAINKNLQIRMDFKGNNFIRCLDEYSIRQIFSNLLDNAIKYTNSGEINIKVYFTDGNCVVEIIDTGIGISNDKIEEIFKPFAQEEQGYTRKFEGNGLGLALVKKYCEMNNAKIEVISKKGEGSIFRVIV